MHRDCSASRIPRRALETAVIQTLSDYILLPDSLTVLLDQERLGSDRRAASRAEALSSLTGERQRLSAQIANLTRAIAERGHSAAMLDRLTQLETQRAAVIARQHQLSAKALACIQDAANTIFVSPATLWEIGIKDSLGKLPPSTSSFPTVWMPPTS
jgi:flagellar biosynthesis/type III secretory pathway chaperone